MAEPHEQGTDDWIFLDDPNEAVSRLRAGGTLAWRDAVLDALIVSDPSALPELLRSAAFLKHPRNALPGPYTDQLSATSADSLLFMDPPDHTRLRSLVNKAFTPRSVEALRPRIAALAEALLDEIGEAATVDLVESFAAPFPTLVIAEMIGVDPSERRQFKGWSDAIAHIFTPQPSEATEQAIASALGEMSAMFARTIAERRQAPRDDVISRLIAAQEADGSRLSDEEMIGLLRLLLNAGNLTTTDLIGNALFEILRRPAQLERLRNEPALLPNAVEEALRYQPPVVSTDRVAPASGEIAGCPYRAGDWLLPMFAGYNRHPSVNESPDEFDVARREVRHVSFGAGPHFCLGAPLARVEAQIGLSAILARYPRLRLAEGFEPAWKPVPGFRGLASLLVRVD